jgi:hypothetical protein
VHIAQHGSRFTGSIHNPPADRRPLAEAGETDCGDDDDNRGSGACKCQFRFFRWATSGGLATSMWLRLAQEPCH